MGIRAWLGLRGIGTLSHHLHRTQPELYVYVHRQPVGSSHLIGEDYIWKPLLSPSFRHSRRLGVCSPRKFDIFSMSYLGHETNLEDVTFFMVVPVRWPGAYVIRAYRVRNHYARRREFTFGLGGAVDYLQRFAMHASRMTNGHNGKTRLLIAINEPADSKPIFCRRHIRNARSLTRPKRVVPKPNYNINQSKLYSNEKRNNPKNLVIQRI
ncbi:hypothetical protein ACGC1H_004867 [Rhizoctonia solani]